MVASGQTAVWIQALVVVPQVCTNQREGGEQVLHHGHPNWGLDVKIVVPSCSFFPILADRYQELAGDRMTDRAEVIKNIFFSS